MFGINFDLKKFVKQINPKEFGIYIMSKKEKLRGGYKRK